MIKLGGQKEASRGDGERLLAPLDKQEMKIQFWPENLKSRERLEGAEILIILLKKWWVKQNS
jgi:hypothetical protein